MMTGVSSFSGMGFGGILGYGYYCLPLLDAGCVRVFLNLSPCVVSS